jgi:hypothetical protein
VKACINHLNSLMLRQLSALSFMRMPKGPPSTILNLRIPLDLLERLDRYLDHLEVQTGLKANRGMIARRAIDLFLETHAPAKRKSKRRRS